VAFEAELREIGEDVSGCHADLEHLAAVGAKVSGARVITFHFGPTFFNILSLQVSEALRLGAGNQV
jgi:hypothetical protein